MPCECPLTPENPIKRADSAPMSGNLRIFLFAITHTGASSHGADTIPSSRGRVRDLHWSPPAPAPREPTWREYAMEVRRILRIVQMRRIRRYRFIWGRAASTELRTGRQNTRPAPIRSGRRICQAGDRRRRIHRGVDSAPLC